MNSAAGLGMAVFGFLEAATAQIFMALWLWGSWKPKEPSRMLRRIPFFSLQGLGFILGGFLWTVNCPYDTCLQ